MSRRPSLSAIAQRLHDLGAEIRTLPSGVVLVTLGDEYITTVGLEALSEQDFEALDLARRRRAIP